MLWGTYFYKKDHYHPKVVILKYHPEPNWG